jgi:hypothetical protein
LHVKSHPIVPHVGDAFGGGVHTAPHARQLFGSAVRLVHWPVQHAGAAAEHNVPIAPQLLTSDETSITCSKFPVSSY